MNPRAAINDLLPFQGSPFGQLGYFSKLIHTSIEKTTALTADSFSNGEGGIRTHAPSRTNGFQDRLVMTTSIPLHLFNYFVVFSDVGYSITQSFPRQYLFSIFSTFLQNYSKLCRNTLAIAKSSGVVIFTF